jgi:6-phospho-beta-glucosidase
MMKTPVKIAFLGGGALRLLSTVSEILRRQNFFPEPHLVFMDQDLPRAQTMAALAQKMPEAEENMPRTEATHDLGAALDGADFVYCVIRVGGVVAMERDERIGAAHGFHGHDDFGPSGCMLTARTLPVVLDIAREIEMRCPDAWFLIFTNPITNMVDGVERYTSVKSIGICPGVYNFAFDVDAVLETGIPPPGLEYRGGGINHLSWICPDASLNGENVMERIFREWDEIPGRKNASRCAWHLTAPLVELDRVMPMNNGHQVHFFFHDQQARIMATDYATTPIDDLRSSKQDRAAAAAAELARQPSIENFWDQEALAGCGPDLRLDLGVQTMDSIHGDLGIELHINVPNHGHIEDLPEGAVVEASARVYRDRIEPLGLDPIPEHHKGLCQSLAHHQRMLVDASVSGDKEQIFRAIMSEPTIRSLDRARPMFEELWDAHTE